MQKRSEPKSVFTNRINPAGIKGREGGYYGWKGKVLIRLVNEGSVRKCGGSKGASGRGRGLKVLVNWLMGDNLMLTL